MTKSDPASPTGAAVAVHEGAAAGEAAAREVAAREPGRDPASGAASGVPTDARPWWDRFARENLPLVFLTAAYLAAGLIVQSVTGINLTRELGWTALLWGALFGLFFVAIAAGSLLAVYLLSRAVGAAAKRRGRPSPFTSRWADYRRHLTPYRLAGIFIVFFLLVPLMNIFVGFKRAIPEIQPFAWDVAFMRLDRALHLGHDPWRLLQPIVGTPIVTAALDFLYYIWFPLKMGVLLWIAWSPRWELRGQFLLTFFTLWVVLGTVAATAFSSVGPCYYGYVVSGPDPFAPLMEYLRGVDRMYPLTALDVQELLWTGYSSGAMHLIEGIAAMPSLHVAIPILYAIAGWKVDRRLGLAFAIYAFVVLIGSVHLGWHYAVDGYASALVVPAVWWGAGRALGAYRQRTDGSVEPTMSVNRTVSSEGSGGAIEAPRGSRL
ncbi:MAG TPA: phosphatase PAP2 family protein [Gemmatimonadota bacterium]|nr:phosphatase PAP2 family protein [Gemmatimonadota bacterium]